MVITNIIYKVMQKNNGYPSLEFTLQTSTTYKNRCISTSSIMYTPFSSLSSANTVLLTNLVVQDVFLDRSLSLYIDNQSAVHGHATSASQRKWC